MAKNSTAGEATRLSRRRVLGAGAAIPLAMGLSPRVMSGAGEVRPLARTASAAAAAERTPDMGIMSPRPGPIPYLEGMETLNAIEMEALEAFCARLVPTDEHGPGAREARAAHYIDRALAGPLMNQRAAYAAGLSALNAYARTAKGQPFAALAPADQDAVLHDLEAGSATGFTPGSAAFFSLVRVHTIEGMFCDPYYGGNANFVGWDLVGYPGLRMAVSPDEQRFAKPNALRQSAYDAHMFGRSRG